MTKRMTANDYAKELHKLELNRIAIKNRMIIRAKELCEQNPDILIQLPEFINSYKAEKYEITKDTNIDTLFVIIETIETELASRHPHKQTKIEFK